MKSLLIKVLPFLARILTGVLAGVIGIAVIVWFGGRYVGLVSVQSRLIAIAVVFAIYLLWLTSKFVYTRFKGKKLVDDLAQSSGDDELSTKLKEVLTSLKSTNLGRRFRGKGALYALPWYMIIGPSAAGKSTFFSRSGLNFPFKDDERYHLSGIGGTKNCDWWFSDQAVLIDTAGRYSMEAENSEWIKFLQLLKKHRSRVPVNGVILALPIDELLTADVESLQAHANNARNRLQEVMAELKLMVPVYVVITKCDMVKGFDAFFEDLSEAESAQPWGVYVLDQTEDRKADVVQILREKITTLIDRLLEQRTQKMLLAKSPLKRADIFQYPSQFSGATDRLLEFVEMLFKDSPYHEKPWFAGVYFTSSVQEGEIIERKNNLLKDVFSKVLGLMRKPGEGGRSYFISELFTQVIFPLKDAVRGSRSRQRFHLAAKSFIFTALLAMSVALGLTLTGTYTANVKLLTDYETKAADLVKRLQSPGISEIERLSSLVALNQHYQDLQEISTYSPLSLFSRYDLIGTHGEPMRNLLVRTLERAMNNQVQPFFMAKLKGYQQQWDALDDPAKSTRRLDYYNYLTVYQMLTTRPEYYERDAVSHKLAEAWYESFGEEAAALPYEQGIDELQNLSSLYLQYAFESLDMDANNVWDQGHQLVASAQQHLMTPPDADMLYKQLLSKGETKYENINLQSLLGPEVDGNLVNKASFSGVYSQQAWNQYVKDEIKRLSYAASKGDWVLGLEAAEADDEEVTRSATKLERDIRRKYFADYVANWNDMVAKTEAPKSRDLIANIQSVKAISEPNGLLTQLFSVVSENMQIAEVAQLSVDKPSAQSAQTETISLPKPPLIPAFASLSKDLRTMLKDTDDSGLADVLEAYLQETKPLADELDSIRVAADVDREAQNYAAGVLSGNSGNKKLYSAWINVDNLLDKQPEASKALLKGAFTSPLKSVWYGMIDASERSLQAVWRDTVYKTYSGTLKGRFPFSDNGADAAVNDVTQFFNPSAGMLWEFVNTDLKPFVQVRSGNWRVRKWLGYGLAFNKNLFSGVNSANRIVTGLFGDQDAIGMRYWVSPVPTPGVSESMLEVDNNFYRYRNEPEEWREFNWSLESSQFAKVEVHMNSGSGIADLSYEGPWAFIKLLRNAQVTHTAGTQFKVAIPLNLSDGRKVVAQYKVRADRAGSVLNQGALKKFYLPKSLFKG